MCDTTIAVEFRDVSKRYRLYSSQLEMFVDLCGLKVLLPSTREYPEHRALDNVNLKIPVAQRVGIIGRNGAGKTTLLKLITGTSHPTTGSVRVHGKVQALMTTGLGFHQELTGAQNIRASLIYNGLSNEEMVEAFDDIVEFAELGEYLHQPLKTCSLGMQARLGFATATAIKPEILIVDEVLGAGDAYFAAKSSARMKKLTSGGLTLLLVSHSMTQIVQFCDRTLWLENGRITMDGETLEVVKAYERFIRDLDEAHLRRVNSLALSKLQSAPPVPAGVGLTATVPSQDSADNSATSRAVSRWAGSEELNLRSFRILNAVGGEQAVFDSGDTLLYEIEIENRKGSSLPCYVAINTYLLDGKQVLLDWSQCVHVPTEGCKVTLRYAPLMLGNGEYVVSIALYETLDMHDVNSARRYDLWDRSFQFAVRTPFPLDLSVCKPPHSWAVADPTRRAPTERLRSPN